MDGNDVTSVYDAVSDAVKRCRQGEGPTLIECKTYRWRGHSKSDIQIYRTKEEVEEWKKKCPIQRFKKRLIKENLLTEEEFEAMDKEVEEAVEEAVKFALDSPYPEEEELFEDVYA